MQSAFVAPVVTQPSLRRFSVPTLASDVSTVPLRPSSAVRATASPATPPPQQTSTPTPTAPTPAISNTVSSTTAPPSIPPDAVPYFAYFANLNPRKIGPSSTLPPRRFPIHSTQRAVLAAHSLVFDVVIPSPIEPVFANIKADPSAQVHGVVHWISPTDFDKLTRSEGVGLPAPSVASVIDVTVDIDGGESIMAKTIQFKGPPKFMLDLVKPKPSKRYVMVAVEGAIFWQLDMQYVENVLRKIEYGTGLYSLYTEPRPHLLDRPNPTNFFGRPSSEIYSPFRSIRAEEAVKNFEVSDDHLQYETTELKNEFQLIQVSPNNDNKAVNNDKKGLYFIPGIDGQGKSILSQVYDIEQEGKYNIKSFVYPYENRESLESLTQRVLQLIIKDNLNDNNNSKPVTIVGESMGGVLAILAALENIKRCEDDATNNKSNTIDVELLMVINPATSYKRSLPKVFWDFLFNLNLSEDDYKVLLPPVLLPFLLDFGSTVTGFAPEVSARYAKVLTSLDKLSDVLPKPAMEHRLKLLSSLDISNAEFKSLGEEGVKGKPKRVAQICTMNDYLIPSFEESHRLRTKVPNIYTTVLPFGGHGPFFDSRFSLASFLWAFDMMSENEEKAKSKRARVTSSTSTTGADAATLAKIKKRSDALRKRYAPSKEEIEFMQKPLTYARLGRLRSFIKPSYDIYSPVFIGEENIPQRDVNRPVLFVGNHTLLGWLDAVLPLYRIAEKRGVLLRSLAHPILFSSKIISFPGFENNTNSDGKLTPEDMIEYGVLKTSPRTLLQTLSRNEWGLLFPGGAADSLKQSNEDKYKVTWPDDPEFVRACALFNAIIIPVSTVGSEDSADIILNSDEFGAVIGAFTRVTGRFPIPVDGDVESLMMADARQWMGNEKPDIVIPPLAIPNNSNDRLYFRFGKAIQVDEICAEDKSKAKAVYEQVREEVKEGVRVLLQRRTKDEFRDKERRKRFRETYGENVSPPAGVAWSWMKDEDSYLHDDYQPPL